MATQLQAPLWLTEAQVREINEFSSNVTGITIYIREAQETEVKNFLGQGLYSAMVADWNDTTKEFDTAAYNDVWFGATYTNTYNEAARHSGLLQAAKYFSLARLMTQQQNNISRFGIDRLQNEIAESSTVAQVRTKQNELQQMGISYMNEVQQFLEANRNQYPLWANSNTVDRKVTAFTFFKV